MMNRNSVKEQIKKIENAELALDRAQTAVSALEKAWEDYLSVSDDIEKLEKYLNSPERRQDLEADEAGKLPDRLRRGVLSEDAIWDLLEQNDGLLNEIKNHPAIKQ